MRTLYTLLLLLISTTLFSGCFNKSVMKDDADNVEEVIIAYSGGENYVISKEEIFQATSKSSKQGIRTTSGYVEYRLTSRNLITGNVEKRIELGVREDNFHYFLGCTEGKLWYVSSDEKLGVHARDPKTLDVIVTTNQIVEKNPFLKNNFPKIKWSELSKYFGFDMSSKSPLITDNNGVVYKLNPNTLDAEKSTKSVSRLEFDKNVESNSIEFSEHESAYLNGNPRNHIEYKGKNFTEPDFLAGQILYSSNVVPMKDIFPDYIKPQLKSIEIKQKKLDSLTNLLNENSDTTNNNIRWKFNYLNDEIKRTVDDIKRDNEEIERNSNKNANTLLCSDRGFFVIHRSSASDTAKVIISKVMLNKEDNTVTSPWSLLLSEIFCDPDKVYDKGGFDYVFSKGSPNLRTKRLVYADDKLVYISMLKAVCVDMKTGKLLWQTLM